MLWHPSLQLSGTIPLQQVQCALRYLLVRTLQEKQWCLTWKFRSLAASGWQWSKFESDHLLLDASDKPRVEVCSNGGLLPSRHWALRDHHMRSIPWGNERAVSNVQGAFKFEYITGHYNLWCDIDELSRLCGLRCIELRCWRVYLRFWSKNSAWLTWEFLVGCNDVLFCMMVFPWSSFYDELHSDLRRANFFDGIKGLGIIIGDE
jgi:hypothetical protein